MAVTNPSITGPLDAAVNVIVGYITAALPEVLYILGCLIGIAVAVSLFRRHAARKAGDMMGDFYDARGAEFEASVGGEPELPDAPLAEVQLGMPLLFSSYDENAHPDDFGD